MALVKEFDLDYLTEEEQLKLLYEAVNTSKFNYLEELLSQDMIRSLITPDQKKDLQVIAKKRGDKKLFWLLDKI